MLTATAAGAMARAVTTARAGSFGNPDEPQGAINAKNRESLTDPGPQDRVLGSQFPRHNPRRRPMWEICRSFGRRLTMR